MLKFPVRAATPDSPTRGKGFHLPKPLRWGIWIFSLLFVVAMIVDLRQFTQRASELAITGSVHVKGDWEDILAGENNPRYISPSGRFSLVPPNGWRVAPKSARGYFDVLFLGPNGMELGIQTAVTNGLTQARLIQELRRRDEALNANSHMTFTTIGPHRVIQRSLQLFKSKVMFLDFVTGDLAHHIQFSAPSVLYDEYEPVMLRLLQTYQPGHALVPAAPPESFNPNSAE